MIIIIITIIKIIIIITIIITMFLTLGIFTTEGTINKNKNNNNNNNNELSRAIVRLSLLPAHDAFTLLKSFFSAPKIMHTLRCSPCFGKEALEEFGSLLRSGLCTITNLAVSDHQWIQASLSVSAGGLGIRRVLSLAQPAFLASAASTHSLQSLLLLNCHCRLTIDSHR